MTDGKDLQRGGGGRNQCSWRGHKCNRTRGDVRQLKEQEVEMEHHWAPGSSERYDRQIKESASALDCMCSELAAASDPGTVCGTTSS